MAITASGKEVADCANAPELNAVKKNRAIPAQRAEGTTTGFTFPPIGDRRESTAAPLPTASGNLRLLERTSRFACAVTAGGELSTCAAASGFTDRATPGRGFSCASRTRRRRSTGTLLSSFYELPNRIFKHGDARAHLPHPKHLAGLCVDEIEKW
jgi:hypothetical protein